MKTLCFVCLVLLTGCVNVAQFAKEVRQDPASVHVSVRSIYVTIEWDRANPGTNTMPHTISDGKVTVTR